MTSLEEDQTIRDYDKTHTFEQRREEATRVLTRHGDRVPVIVQKDKKCDMQEIDKRKYLVPKDLTMEQFSRIIEKRLKDTLGDKILYVMVNSVVPEGTELVSKIYEKYKSPDEFLRVVYTTENPEVKQHEFKIFIANLKVISELQEYEKLWVTDDILTKNHSFAIVRMIYGQSREIIMPIVAKTVKNLLDSMYNDSDEVRGLLTASIQGLKNLAVTYPPKHDELYELVGLINAYQEKKA